MASVLGSILTCLCAGDRNCLDFSVRIEIDLFLVGGSKLTSLFCAGRKILFCVRGSIDLVSASVLKLTWFLYSCRKLLGFSLRIRIDLISVWGWNLAQF